MASNLMDGRIVLITGATSGIGNVTAKALAGMGATMVILGRDKKKGEKLLSEIKSATGNASSEYMVCDLASLDDVRRSALDFNARYDRLDVLIDNAGGINGRRKLTKDGFEYTFGVNHLAHFVLTNLLLEKLRSSAPSRIVVTSSLAHISGHIDFDDLMAECRYRFLKVYGSSKLANALFTFELARRLEGKGVTANCFHPGATNSNFVSGIGIVGRIMRPIVGLFEISPERGADTQIFLASSPEVEGVTGKYFFKRKVKHSSDESMDHEVARRLWQVSEDLTRPWLGA